MYIFYLINKYVFDQIFPYLKAFIFMKFCDVKKKRSIVSG